MKPKVLVFVGCAVAATALSTSVFAQAKTAAATYKAPRDAYGQPDLSGTWTNESLTRMERQPQYGDRLTPTPEELAKAEGARAAYIKAGESAGAACDKPGNAFMIGCGYSSVFTDSTLNMMRVNGQPRTSLITFPANGRIPRRARGARGAGATEEGKRDNPEDRSISDRCIVGQNVSTGALLTPTNYNNNFVFQQNKDFVVVVTEMSHDARTVRLNAQHDNLPRYLGDSVGHWEGDTLVVDTVHFDPMQLQLQGNSSALHLVERFTRVGPGRILYQFRVEDPAAYTEPWGGEYEFSAAKGQQYEYACHEGDYALEDILAGARQDEADIAAGKKPAAKQAPVAGGPEE